MTDRGHLRGLPDLPPEPEPEYESVVLKDGDLEVTVGVEKGRTLTDDEKATILADARERMARIHDYDPDDTTTFQAPPGMPLDRAFEVALERYWQGQRAGIKAVDDETAP